MTQKDWSRRAILGAGMAVVAACARRPPATQGEGSMAMEQHSGGSVRMPVGFVGHGSPMTALDAVKGAPLRRWGGAVERPRAVVVISAHWEDAPAAVGTVRQQSLMYDFGGFPESLYRVQYPSPGAPDVGDRIASLLGVTEPVRRIDRPLDHGVWCPLVHMFPEADIPVLQVSLPTRHGAAACVELGRQLAPLRDEGVFVLGSGNVVHNLRRIDFSESSPPPSWATEFDAWTREQLDRHDIDALIGWEAGAPAARTAHPTPDHWLPLLVAAGAASSDGVAYPVEGWEVGSISRRCVQFG
jgi:4,5-DOPA dioxygenase extradiol